MGAEPISLSRLIRSLSTEPIDATGSPSDVSKLDLKDICSLRQRSIRKFSRALDDIATRYEGDGDEEADDVVDLENLQVIEDRGYIINRFSNRSQSSQASSSSSDKGKRRANQDLDFLSILNPILLEDDDEWVDEDNEDRDSDDYQETDDDHDDPDNQIQHEQNGIDNDPFLISSSSPSSSKIPFPTGSPQRKKLTRLCSNHLDSSVTNLSSNPSSPPRHVGTQAYHRGDDTMTNALFERLKKRVMERSSDITKYRLSKKSITRRCDNQKIPMSSSPSSSLNSSFSLCSALKPTKHILSPYLQRLLNPDHENPSVVRPHSSLEPPKISVMIPPFTPITVRKKRQIENSSSDTTIRNDGVGSLIRNKMIKGSTSKSSTLSGSPKNQPTFNATSSIGSSSSSRLSLNYDDEDPSTALFTSEQFKPTFLFKSRHQVLDSDSQTSTPTAASKIKKIKSGHGSHHRNAQESLQPPESVEYDRSSRESSEDPLYLPPSSKKRKT